MSDNTSSKGIMNRRSLSALLKTIAEDKHCKIHKLEIRLKQNDEYSVIAIVSKEKNVNQQTI